MAIAAHERSVVNYWLIAVVNNSLDKHTAALETLNEPVYTYRQEYRRCGYVYRYWT